jgi:hypothetical protein
VAIIRITQPPGVTPEMYEAVNAKIGVRESPPEGLIMHSAGDVDGTWQIVDVWESQEHARRFDEERLGPAVREITGMGEPPAPTATVYEAYNVIVP